MSSASLDLAGPWTFDDLADLPGDGRRYEVVDGSLLVSPQPSDFHQAIARRLYLQLHKQAPPAWEVVYEVAFRVRTDGRVPDLAVVRSGVPVRPGEVAYRGADFALLVEVVSANSTGMDRVLKPTEYAAAGVPFYWRVELEPTVHVVAHRLEGGAYAEVGRLEAGRGVLPGPWDVLVDVAALA